MDAWRDFQIRDGVISSKENPGHSTTFAALARANGGPIRLTGRGVAGGERGGSNKGVGACFAEIEVGYVDRRLEVHPSGRSTCMIRVW